MASDLVSDSKLSVRFSATHTHHVVFESNSRPGQQVRRQRKEESWERVKHLGAGGFGSVWLEQCLRVDSHPKTRAVKAIPKLTSSLQPIDYKRELEAIAKFSQVKYEGFFVKSFGWYEDTKCAYIAMEYFALGDLQHYLEQPLPERETKQITHQLLEGLEQLHMNGYAHRDLKPANIFVVQTSPDWWVKIGDFGISKRVNDGRTSFRTEIGTPGFIAPEVLDKESSDVPYTAKVDMWSLGVLVHYMITTTLPFNDRHRLRKYARDGDFPSRSLASRSSSQCLDFVTKGLLTPTAGNRLSASDALQHQWLRGLYASSPIRETNHFNGTQNRPATHPANGQYMESDSRAVSASLDFTDASASWGGPIGTERQLPVRIKHEVTQGSQNKSTALWQPKPPKQIPISSAQNELHTLHDKGLSLMKQKSYPDAQKMLQQAFELRKNVLGVHHEDTLTSLGALGKALCAQEKYIEAESAFRQAWEGRKETLGADHEDTLDSLDDIGEALKLQERYPEAETSYTQAWEGRKEVLGAYHDDTLYTLSSIGETMLLAGKKVEAERVYRQVWDALKKSRGADHEDTLVSLDDLGLALMSQDDYTEAEAVYRQLWERRKRTLGAGHEDTLESLSDLGEVLRFQEKYSEAEATYRQVWKGRKETLGADHEDTLESLDDLAVALGSQDKYTEAEAAYRQVWKRRKETLGAIHEDTLQSLQTLGIILDLQRKPAKAESAFREAWKGRREALGADHRDTLRSLQNLGDSLWFQDKNAQAETVYRQAWEALREAFGTNDVETLASLHQIGDALRSQKKFAEAEIAYQKAWEGRKQVLGANHEDTLHTRNCLRDSLRQSSPFAKTPGKSESSLRKSIRSLWR